MSSTIPQLYKDLGSISRIMTDGFFAKNTNFITFQLEKLTTYFSVEATFMSCDFPNSLQSMIICCKQSTGAIVGYAELDNRNFTKQAPSYPNFPYMCNLVVDKKYQGMYIGKALVYYCEDRCLQMWGENKLYLKVKKSNYVALELYQSLGYEVISTIIGDSKVSNNLGDMLFVLRKEFT